MNNDPEMIMVQVNLDITPEALQAVVASAKKVTGKDTRGVYRVDTADYLGKVISQFLYDHDFDAFARELNS